MQEINKSESPLSESCETTASTNSAQTAGKEDTTTAEASAEIQNTPDEEKREKKKHSVVFALLTWVCRIVTGGTFIFSGVSKAIDPWGTIYKMHDYISALPEGMFSWVLPLLTVGCFTLFSAEVLIGVSLITGCYRRIGAIGGLLMMLFMLPLTLWIALADPVADCGCFGDAWILSNWETFWKNVVLSLMCVWLVIFNKRARCLIIPTLQWLMFIGTIAFSVTIGFVGYSIQPMIDFRPYPVGEMLTDSSEASATESESELMAVWKNGDNTITIPADSIPEGEDWEFIERVEEASDKDSTQPADKKSKGLAIFDNNEDITEEIIEQEGEQVIVFINDLPAVSTGTFYKLNSLYAYCKKHDIVMIAVAAATPLQISDFYNHSLAEYPIYTAEDTAIKEVVRGNPAVTYLKDGKLLWKSSLQAIPTLDFMESTPDKPGALAMYAPSFGKYTFKSLILAFVGFLGIVILLSHVPMVIRLTTRRIRKSRWVKDGGVVKVLLPALIIMSCACSCSKDEPALPKEDAQRTILIYMVATNNLSYDAREDLNEILQGYDAAAEHKANILIYLTRPNEEKPSLGKIVLNKAGKAEFQTIKRYASEESSVSQTRISEVIEDVKLYAPAPEYGLFLWSHATGWLPPASSADTPAKSSPILYSYGDDYGKAISITGLAKAIPQDMFSFIWMDCCYMGGVEVSYELRNHCEYIVAYPTEVLSAGAPYDLLIPILSKKEISLTEAADATYSYYADNSLSQYRSCAISITRTHDLERLASICREIIATGDPYAPTQGIQTYGRYNGIYFYDFEQAFSTICHNNYNADLLSSHMPDIVVFKRSTPKVLNIIIDPSHYSGLSCHMLANNTTAATTDCYESLAWYKAVYE